MFLETCRTTWVTLNAIVVDKVTPVLPVTGLLESENGDTGSKAICCSYQACLGGGGW